mmetsp:Transcript_2835/g.7949  ORF Transcript_2835/g.7949 Transcript_2835/m.7949 type:complete len:415 (+) Transcript_2835:218-1462(+)|eukprot:CAMPEP_0117662260 /NCGR_PEP_ID=MMETSP0804-20121206/7961_1 /TAXON_ID=1074897 /ORGANISM="Tetraselmis astigmatica, Strain CCMP880" /LENGTH=414 /DNA_ID=CAMNT_0005469153 /DNA_START=172 /DNA_END=1416 /DNA_ORIENTATION=+
MGIFDPVPHPQETMAGVKDNTMKHDRDEAPLASEEDDFMTSALSEKERKSMATRQQVSDEDVEVAPLPDHLKMQGPGPVLDGMVLHNFDPEARQEAMCCRMSPDGKMVAVGCQDGRVRLVSATPGAGVVHTLGDEFPKAVSPCCTALRWRPDSWKNTETMNQLLVARGDEVRRFHSNSGHVMAVIQERGNSVYALATCVDKPLFASAGADRHVRVYDEGKSKVACMLKSGGEGGIATHSVDNMGTGHTNSVYAVAWVPRDPHVLLSGGWDNTIQIWDSRVGHAVRCIFGPHICGDSIDVHGGHILTGSWRSHNPLQLWDYGTGKLLTNLPVHQHQPESCLLYSAQFGAGKHHKKVIAGGSGKDPAVYAIRSTGEVIGHKSTTSPVHSIDTAVSSENGNLSVAVCCAKQLLLLQV